MYKRLVLLASIALVLGIAIPIAMYLLTPINIQSKSEITKTIPLIELPKPPFLNKTQENQLIGFSSFRDLYSVLMRTYNMLISTAVSPYMSGIGFYIEPFIREMVESKPVSATKRVSWTNVQVEGIDEPDIVKTNGELIVIAKQKQVIILDALEKRTLFKLSFEEEVKSIFLHGNILVAMNYKTSKSTSPIFIEGDVIMYPPDVYTIIYVIDLMTPTEPRSIGKIEIGGEMLSSRLMNGIVYVVTTMPAFGEMAKFIVPVVNGRVLDPSKIALVGDYVETYTTIIALNISSLEYSTTSILMPYSSRMYMSYDRLYVLSTNQPIWYIDPYIVLLSVIRVLIPELSSKIDEYLNQSDLFSAFQLVIDYIANAENRNELVDRIKKELRSIVLNDETHIYVFNVIGLNLSYFGNVKVEGLLLDQFAIEEHNGFLLIATTRNSYGVELAYEVFNVMKTTKDLVIKICVDTNCTTVTLTPGYNETSLVNKPNVYIYPYLVARESDNRVYVLRLENLEIKGILKDLAPGERIYAARLVKNILFLVTFRQVDPLFAIDVSVPEEPRILGYLKIPGFSEYLHPLPNELLLGIGIEGNDLKISLFDVKDPTKMNEISKVNVPSVHSPVLQDHHAITIDLDYKQIYIPIHVRNYYGPVPVPGAVLVISYEGGVLTVRSVIDHPGVIRTLYIDNEFFTISYEVVKVFDLNTMEQVGEIILS